MENRDWSEIGKKMDFPPRASKSNHPVDTLTFCQCN